MFVRTHAAFLLGLALPLLAQKDISGTWSPRYHEEEEDRMQGPALGDYLGIPLNEAARLRAESWSASILTLPERQCMPHPADYGTRGPADLRITQEFDAKSLEPIAYHLHIRTDGADRTIWMDGRSHPSEYAAHTWQGFSTGEWVGGALTVTTTHLKPGFIRRNGVPRSDRATMTEHWMRHGDLMTMLQVIDDPVYLTEPMIRTTDWVVNPDLIIGPFPCESVEEVVREAGIVPHYLPGKNAFLQEFLAKNRLPAAANGGAETLYPEFRLHPEQRNVRVPPPERMPASRSGTATVGLKVIPIRGGIFMIAGAGSNITVQQGGEGVLLVNSGLASKAGEELELIRSISAQPIGFIVNTSANAEDTGGNETLKRTGKLVTGFGGANIASQLGSDGAGVIAHENVLRRMSSGATGSPQGAWPTDTFFGRRKTLYFNGEAIEILHQRATTDGDTIVFFRRSDVLSTGGVFDPASYPRIDIAKGGSVQGVLDALNRIIEIAVPADREEGGTYIIPGRGRVCDRSDVTEYRDMVTIIRDRVRAMIRGGMTLDQVKASHVSRDYDPLYDSAPDWTPEMFIEAVYRSLGGP